MATRPHNRVSVDDIGHFRIVGLFGLKVITKLLLSDFTLYFTYNVRSLSNILSSVVAAVAVAHRRLPSSIIVVVC